MRVRNDLRLAVRDVRQYVVLFGEVYWGFEQAGLAGR